MEKKLKIRGNRAKGLFGPPNRFRYSRDPVRIFSRSSLEPDLLPHAYNCFNPLCTFSDYELNAHHLYAHSLGGRTVTNNAIILCKFCHDLVHRGVIPLTTLLDWKRGESSPIDSTFLFPDELLIAVRAVPVTSGLSPQERLIRLNKYLIEANCIKSLTSRCFILGQIMLAKAAVLNDSYRDIRDDMESATKSMKNRYLRILPFTSSARRLGREVNSPAIVVRALHYRSIVYETLQKNKRALEELRKAVRISEIVSPQGKPNQFHELSTPARILRSLALNRAKLGGLRSQSEKEYELGLSLSEKYGDIQDWQEGKLRHIQLHVALKQISIAEKMLDKGWDEILTMDMNSQLIGHRLRIETLLHKHAKREAEDLIQYALQQASKHRLYRQEHHLYKLKKFF